MFIGHFAVMYILIGLFTAIPLLVILCRVSVPDLPLPALVLTGKESVTAYPHNPFRNAIRFTSCPYPHSMNAYSSLGFSRKNPIPARRYVALAIFGFLHSSAGRTKSSQQDDKKKVFHGGKRCRIQKPENPACTVHTWWQGPFS